MERGGTKKFITSGILPLFGFIFSIFYSCSQNNSHNEQNVPLKDTNSVSEITVNYDSLYHYYAFRNEYQFNEILFDNNDSALMQLDTVLYFSDQKNLFEVTVNKENIEIVCMSWKEMPDNTVKFKQEGFQKNGFIYIKNEQTGNYEIEYKIILNKGLFFWNDSHWYLLNSGDS
jgi:hypothetical protein